VSIIRIRSALDVYARIGLSLSLSLSLEPHLVSLRAVQSQIIQVSRTRSLGNAFPHFIRSRDQALDSFA